MVATATAPFNNLSPQLKALLRAPTGAQTVKFMLLGENYPPSFRIEPQYTILDPGTNEYITIANAKDMRLEAGERVPNAQEIAFEAKNGCVIEVGARDLPKLIALRLGPHNADNPVIENRRAPLYREIKPEVDARKRVDHEAQVDVARPIVALAGAEDLIFLGKEFGLNVLPDFDDNGQPTYDRLRADLYKVAGTEPNEIITRSRSEVTKAHALVRELVTRQIVRFDESAGAWEMVDSTETLCPVSASVSREDGFVQWLTRTADGKIKQAQFREHLKGLLDQEAQREAQRRQGGGRKPNA